MHSGRRCVAGSVHAPSSKPPTNDISFGFLALLAALATLSPFAIDTYIPALAAVRESLGATAVQTQQSLSAYMFGLALMALWHGAISDALGRRPVVLAGLVVYSLASVGCALTTDVNTLIVLRFVQGLAGGVGMIIVRAIVRDTLQGAAAQRVLSHVMMMFGVAPAIAPIIGGWLYQWLGWRSIFWFLFLGGAVLTVWAALALRETLPKSQRQSLHPIALAKGYARLLRLPAFWALSLAPALAFQAFFQYVGAAHPFMVEHLGFRETQFGYLFASTVAGFMLGAAISGRVAGKWSVRRTASVAFVLMLGAALFSVAYHSAYPPSPWPSIAPIFVSTTGISMFSPITQLLVMELVPTARGLAASCHACVQLLVSAISLGIVSIALSGSVLTLTLGQLGWVVCGLLAWLGYLAVDRSLRRARTLMQSEPRR